MREEGIPSLFAYLVSAGRRILPRWPVPPIIPPIYYIPTVEIESRPSAQEDRPRMRERGLFIAYL